MKKDYYIPGRVSALYLVGYACVRFVAEYLKELPSSEMYGLLSVSQRLMLVFLLV
ncbi:MAG: prolipoprotein diacylglyceryl transferase [Candidatus Peribacteria bacterium]|nr:MAG: prolipoprotein diacylglyceryl transferase [Candidatus Peribacteria bacterium]